MEVNLNNSSSKGRWKDRYVPYQNINSRTQNLHEAKTYLFNGPPSITGSDFDSRYSQRGVQWAVKQWQLGLPGGLCAYAGTLLLRIYSNGLDIITLKKILGHENIETTMDYLHIAQLDTIKPLVHLIPCLPSGGSSYVLDKLGQNIENLGLNTWQLRTLSAVRRCRTAALGDILIVVIHVRISALAITPRNRHCPKCQGKTEKIGYKLDKASF
jgi:hypothetical protein